ncbi:MAG TPA: hypothetical protein VL175_13395 [Pirellulales bacterium]|nr:hypothetical protein [Pirellulales bacterium]
MQRSQIGILHPVRRNIGGGWLALLLGILSSTPATADERWATLAERAPAQTSLAILSSDIAGTCATFQKTELGKTVCGGAFAPLIAELTRLDRASALRMKPAFGIDWSELAATHAPAGLFVFPLPDGTAGIAWIVGRPQGAPDLAAQALSYFKQRGFLETRTARGPAQAIHVQPADRRLSPRGMFVAPGVVAFANSPAALAVVLSAGAGRSLAADPVFAGTLRASGKPPNETESLGAELAFFVRPVELERSLRAKSQNEPQQPAATQKPGTSPADDRRDSEEPTAKAHRLGWDALQAAWGRIRLDANQVNQWEIHADVLAPGPYRGAMRMLELQAGPAVELPNWIPAGANSFGAWHWKFAAAIQGFGSIFDESNEPGPDGEGLFEDMLNGLRDDPEGVRVDLRRGVFDQLEPGMLRVNLPANSPKPDGPGSAWVYLAQARNGQVVRQTLDRFYEGDDRVHHSRTGSFDMWSVDEGASLFVEGESSSVVTVQGLAFDGQRLLFSTDADTLAKVLAGPAERPLADDPAWQTIGQWMSTLPGSETCFRSFNRLSASLQEGYQAAIDGQSRDDSLPAQLWRRFLFGSSSQRGEPPYQAAPRFDQLQNGLAPAGVVVDRMNQGWKLSLSGLRTEQPAAESK